MAVRVTAQELEVGYLPTPLNAALVTSQELEVAYLPTPLNAALVTSQELEVAYLASTTAVEARWAEYPLPLVTNAPMTVSAWVYTSVSDVEQCVFSLTNRSSDTGYYGLFILPGGSILLKRYTNSPSATLHSVGPTTVYTAGSWANITYVIKSNDSVSVFLNGGSKATSTTAIQPGWVDTTSIGRLGTATPGAYFSGNIAGVVVYNIDLPDAAVGYLGRGFSPLSTVLSGYARFIQGYYPLTTNTQTLDIVRGKNLRSYGFDITSRGPLLKEEPFSKLNLLGAPNMQNAFYSMLVQDKLYRKVGGNPTSLYYRRLMGA